MLRALRIEPLALLLALAATACSSLSRGPTEEFEARAPHTVFVLAPPSAPITGLQAEGVRRALMNAMRQRGYGVSSAADATLVSVIEEWGSEVTLSAQLLDAEQRVLWSDRATTTRSRSDRRKRRNPPEELAARAAYDLLRSLPHAPPRR